MNVDVACLERIDGRTRRLILAAPRANALTPALLDALRGALDKVATDRLATLMVAGRRNFCSSDMARFCDEGPAGRASCKWQRVAPALRECVSRFWHLPVFLGSAARGAITGRSAGLWFDTSCAVPFPDAFFHPRTD